MVAIYQAHDMRQVAGTSLALAICSKAIRSSQQTPWHLEASPHHLYHSFLISSPQTATDHFVPYLHHGNPD